MRHVFCGMVAVSLMLSPMLGQAKADYTFTTLDVPGSADSLASGINDAGQIVGYYREVAGLFHGFLLDVDGTYTTFDPPGSTYTFAEGINAAGQIVGSYVDAGGTRHGFLLDVDGTQRRHEIEGSSHT